MASKKSVIPDITNHRSSQSNKVAVKEGKHPVNTARSVEVMPRTGGPALKQATFDSKAAANTKNYETFEIKVKNIIMTNSYSLQDSEHVPYSTGFIEMDCSLCKH